jgi:acetyl esterase
MAERFPPLQRFRPGLVRPLHWCIERPFSPDKEVMAKVRDYTVPVVSAKTGKGSATIKLRAYYPDQPGSSQPRPAMVYFHGGGCVFGSVASHDIFCRYVARYSGQVVLSVDYRCAPEFKFPVPVEDAICAWNWVCENAAKLNVDIARTGVGGDSAGGYLATSVCLQQLKPALASVPLIMPAYQWLFYPMLDLRCETESYQRCTGGMLLTQDLMHYFRRHYLNNAQERNNPVASPLLTESLAGLPPTFLLTAGHDPLVDEGQSYAAALKEQNCPLVQRHYPNCMHGFTALSGICQDARKAVDEAIQVLPELLQKN